MKYLSQYQPSKELKMNRVKTVSVKNIEYEQSYWKWEIATKYPIDTREFSKSGNIERMRFDEYCENWANKLNSDEETHLYTVGSRYEDTVQYEVTVIKLKGE